MSIAAAAYPNLSYHLTKTFIPLTMIANFPLILVVPPDHPAKTVKEMVEWAKKNPDKANYASDLAGLHHRERAAQAQERHAGTDDPLQEQQRDDPERHPGPDAACDLGRPAGHSADQGRQGEGARGHRRRPIGRGARRAEHEGSGLPRGEHQAVQRLLRFEGHRRRRSSPSSKQDCARLLPIRT